MYICRIVTYVWDCAKSTCFIDPLKCKHCLLQIYSCVMLMSIFNLCSKKSSKEPNIQNYLSFQCPYSYINK